jgi:geranylgeranyl diphosphate synthase type II
MTVAAALDPDLLAAYQHATSAIIEGYLVGREPRRHLYEPMSEFVARGGKGIRPALCLASCQAFGGRFDDAGSVAASIELLHAAFMIHDDIEDASSMRRGQPALHVEVGVPLALNTGDALAALCLRPLLDSVDLLGGRLTRRILFEFQLALERTVEGQAVELGWRCDNVVDLSPRDYLDMVLHKTCAYTTILPLRVGALVGSAGAADVGALATFGFALGAAFQIQDDLLDLTSDETAYGKDPLGDVREGKRTLPLMHLLRTARAAHRGEVVDFLGRPPAERSDDQVRYVRELMDRYESIEFAREFALSVAEMARASTDDAFAACRPSRELEFLRASVAFMTERPM